MHGYPMSHIIEPMTLGRISLRLYASMNKEVALDAPSKHKNILIVDINGLVDMRDLKEKQYEDVNFHYHFDIINACIAMYLKFRIEKNV